MENKKHNFFAFLRAITERDYNHLLSIIHPNAQFEFPFELIEKYKLIDERDEIIGYLLNDKIKRTFSAPKLMEDTSKGTILVELQAVEYFPQMERSLNQEIICRIGFEDDQIKFYKEYFNPITRLEGLLDMNNEDLDNYFNPS